jgi:CRISPR-associated protein Csd1
MLLQKLKEYYSRLDPIPTRYQDAPIKWVIDLNTEGQFLGFTATTGSGGKRDRGVRHLVPQLGRSSGIKAKLLADNGEYVLGESRQKSQKEKVRQKHQSFIELVSECAQKTQEPSVKAVLRFLTEQDPAKLLLPEGFDPSMNLTFRVNGVWPVDLARVREFWAGKAVSDPSTMQCLICGHEKPPVRRLEFKIKRVPGGQPSGMALISANAPAFESFGLTESLIAPTCQECGESFSKSANSLIGDERTSLTIGPLRYIFWTREKEDFSFAALLTKPEPGEVRLLFEAVLTGSSGSTEIDPNPFYAAAFGASGGRVAVRDWLDSTVGRAKHNLARYFVLQDIVERDGRECHPIGLFALAASAVPDATKDLPPNIPQSLLHVALKGGILPASLLARAIGRNCAEQAITRPRAALIKMVLLSQQAEGKESDFMKTLEPQNTHPGYVCGRLLAVLESVQRAALPGVNTTITDRFFGTASSAPASVFGRLVRGAQAHLGKLRREKPRTYEALERRLEEVNALLGVYPKVLSLEEQGYFALGYYHQRATDRAAAIAHKQARERGLQNSEGTEEE